MRLIEKFYWKNTR